jgi:hypothetical protein
MVGLRGTTSIAAASPARPTRDAPINATTPPLAPPTTLSVGERWRIPIARLARLGALSLAAALLLIYSAAANPDSPGSSTASRPAAVIADASAPAAGGGSAAPSAPSPTTSQSATAPPPQPVTAPPPASLPPTPEPPPSPPQGIASFSGSGTGDTGSFGFGGGALTIYSLVTTAAPGGCSYSATMQSTGDEVFYFAEVGRATLPAAGWTVVEVPVSAVDPGGYSFLVLSDCDWTLVVLPG